MSRIAIIGGGAAGTGAAYQLYKKLGRGNDITLYESQEHVGGRAWDLNFAGCRIEVGGVLLHSTGQITMEMMEFSGSKESRPASSLDGKGEVLAFWTDKGFVIRCHTTLASMAWHIVKHVGVGSALRVTNSAKEMAGRYEGIYKLLAEQPPGQTADDIFGTLGLIEPSRISTAEYFKQIRVNNRMAYDVVEAITNNMYNQGAEMNALASLVGLAGAGLAGGYLFVIEGGNWTLYDKVLSKAGINVRTSTTVDRLLITGAHDGNRASYKLVTTDGEVEAYDAVILAAPPALADISVELDGAPFPVVAHPYQPVWTTLVAGEPRPEYFGLKPGTSLPATVFNASSAPAPFKSIRTAGISPEYGTRVYRIFSANHQLTDTELDEIFIKVLDKREHYWKGAYPVLTPGIEHLPFTLHDGLFFACALETIAGSIEVETVGGVNAANLALAYLTTQDIRPEKPTG